MSEKISPKWRHCHVIAYQYNGMKINFCNLTTICSFSKPNYIKTKTRQRAVGYELCVCSSSAPLQIPVLCSSKQAQVSQRKWYCIFVGRENTVKHGCDILLGFGGVVVSNVFYMQLAALHISRVVKTLLTLSWQNWHFDQWSKHAPPTSLQTVHRQESDRGRLIFCHIAWGGQWTGIHLN